MTETVGLLDEGIDRYLGISHGFGNRYLSIMDIRL